MSESTYPPIPPNSHEFFIKSGNRWVFQWPHSGLSDLENNDDFPRRKKERKIIACMACQLWVQEYQRVFVMSESKNATKVSIEAKASAAEWIKWGGL